MMGKLKEIYFKDFVKLQRGFDLPTKDRFKGKYPVVSSTEISGHHNKYKVQGPGVVTGRSGSLGSVQYIKGNFWPLNTTLWVKDFKNNYPLYVYYFLQMMPLERFGSGASVPTLNRNHLDMCKIKVHKYIGQKKTANMLYNYEKLVENNNKRIKILEDIAKLIYREWFANFRFPEHEDVMMVYNEELDKEIPEGWSIVTVRDIVKRIPAGKLYDSKTVECEASVPILDQGQSGIIGYHNDEPGVQATPDKPVIVFANHTCYQRLILFQFSAIQNVLPFVSREENERDIYWLHWTTKDLVKFNDYKGHWPEFLTKKLVMPRSEICSQFGKLAKPIVGQIYKLELLNRNLSKTRDMLLPRLVTGHVDVSGLDIKITESL